MCLFARGTLCKSPSIRIHIIEVQFVTATARRRLGSRCVVIFLLSFEATKFCFPASPLPLLRPAVRSEPRALLGGSRGAYYEVLRRERVYCGLCKLKHFVIETVLPTPSRNFCNRSYRRVNFDVARARARPRRDQSGNITSRFLVLFDDDSRFPLPLPAALSAARGKLSENDGC